MRKLYENIANALLALRNCEKSGNTEWLNIWRERLELDLRDILPSGSGFDCGSKLDIEASKPNRLVFHTEYHHMDEGGFYAGWTKHAIIVTPSLAQGFDVRITGQDRNQIKDYIGIEFAYALNKEHEWESV